MSLVEKQVIEQALERLRLPTFSARSDAADVAVAEMEAMEARIRRLRGWRDESLAYDDPAYGG